MRIQVLFNGTPVVVPCGDGKILVRELIEKAVQRYKKLPNKVSLRAPYAWVELVWCACCHGVSEWKFVFRPRRRK